MADKTITIELGGIEELQKRFASLDKDGRKRVSRQINVGAIEFQRAAKNGITKRSGRYRRYRRGGKWHYSSMPGAYPNSDTGNLRKNLRVTSRASLARTYAEVISGASYSKALEEGHKNRSGRRTAARPFMSTTMRKMNRQLVSRIKQAIRGLL